MDARMTASREERSDETVTQVPYGNSEETPEVEGVREAPSHEGTRSVGKLQGIEESTNAIEELQHHLNAQSSPLNEGETNTTEPPREPLVEESNNQSLPEAHNIPNLIQEVIPLETHPELPSKSASQIWQERTLLTLWLLTTVVLFLATIHLATHITWTGFEIFTAIHIPSFSYQLSLTQAKGIDFFASAVVAPFFIGFANYVWFKTARRLSVNESKNQEFDPTLRGNVESGSYNTVRLISLVKNSGVRGVLFAILLLASALASTLLCNVLAYQAVSRDEERLPGDGEEMLYRMVYIPGILFGGLCNVTLASSVALVLVLDARRSPLSNEEPPEGIESNILVQDTGGRFRWIHGVKQLFFFGRKKALSSRHPLDEEALPGERTPLLGISNRGTELETVRGTSRFWKFSAIRVPSFKIGKKVANEVSENLVAAEGSRVLIDVGGVEASVVVGETSGVTISGQKNPQSKRATFWKLPRLQLLPIASSTPNVKHHIAKPVDVNATRQDTILNEDEVPGENHRDHSSLGQRSLSWRFPRFRLPSVSYNFILSKDPVLLTTEPDRAGPSHSNIRQAAKGKGVDRTDFSIAESQALLVPHERLHPDFLESGEREAQKIDTKPGPSHVYEYLWLSPELSQPQPLRVPRKSPQMQLGCDLIHDEHEGRIRPNWAGRYAQRNTDIDIEDQWSSAGATRGSSSSSLKTVDAFEGGRGDDLWDWNLRWAWWRRQRSA